MTLQKTLLWAQPYFPTNTLNLGSTSQEPFLSNANIVQQTILGPPFAWRWNRTTITQSLSAGTQDYDYTAAVASNTFGFLEYASLTTSGGSPTIYQIPHIQSGLPLTSFRARPSAIAPQIDSTSGSNRTVTFRYVPVPDATYTATLAFQKTATLMTGLSSSWSIPDDMAYVYQWGFLSMCLLAVGDPRWQIADKTFLDRLMSTSELLNEQKNAFFETWAAARSQARWFQEPSKVGAGN